MLLRMRTAQRRSVTALWCAAAIIQTASGQAKDSASSPAVAIGGFVDTYFSYNAAVPRTHSNQLRNFDVTADEFSLAMAEVDVQKAASPVGFRLDVDLGPANDIVQSGATGSIANIGQAYVTVVAPLGAGLTVDAGKFVTHCCFETIKAKDNFNYSRSLLFAWSVPYYHLGLRASYPVTGTVTLNGYLYNGWNGTVSNSGKAFGFEATYAPTSAWSLTFNWLGGPADPDSVSRQFRNLYEVIASYQATEKLTLVLNAVYGQDEPLGRVALWKGVAGYVRYVLNDVSALALRGEVFNDPEGFMTSTTQELHEATATYEYKPFAPLILRGEYRYDWSTAVVFDGNTGPLMRKTQSTLAVGAIVLF